MDWEKFDKNFITSIHGDMYKYRDLYNYRHAAHSPRATDLLQKGEIVDRIERGVAASKNVRTPYLIFNVSRIICDVPALFVSRSIGEVKTNHPGVRVASVESDEEADPNLDEDDARIESPTGDNEPVDLQQALIKQITQNSGLTRKHKSNILQHQVDGGIVGVPIMRNGQLSIQFKERNVYYPHDDELGVDLVYELPERDENGSDYVHVYTERQTFDPETNTPTLKTYNRLYERRRAAADLKEVTDQEFIKKKLGIEELEKDYEGRQRTFVDYLGNEMSFMNPLGVSALAGQEGKQEEINWTITRAGMTFERNGKPRLGLSSKVFDRLEALAEDRYGDPAMIDHRDLEVVELDENGEAIKVYQIDIKNIGDMSYVKDLTRQMLTETSTSEKAAEFLNEGSTSAAQSGVAKFYDLLYSVMKAEELRDQYIDFLQGLYESALWLARRNDEDVIIERPTFILADIIPITQKESNEDAVLKREAKVQSLKATVRELHPEKSEEWIDREVEALEGEVNNADTMSLSRGQQTLQAMLGNRSAAGVPLNEDGSERGGNDE